MTETTTISREVESGGEPLATAPFKVGDLTIEGTVVLNLSGNAGMPHWYMQSEQSRRLRDSFTEEERTFFYAIDRSRPLSGPRPYLVVPLTDPRSYGMWQVSPGNSVRPPDGHRGWWLDVEATDRYMLKPFVPSAEVSEIEKFVVGMAMVTSENWTSFGPFTAPRLTSDDERTFFYADDPVERFPDHILLVCHEDDPRSDGMWSGNEVDVPEGHKCWRLPKERVALTPFPATEKVEDPLDEVRAEVAVEAEAEAAEPSTPEPKFAPGDHLRVVDASGSYSARVGQIVTVNSVGRFEAGPARGYLVNVKRDDGYTYAMYEHRFVKVEEVVAEPAIPERKFVRGDRLRVVDASGSMSASLGDLVLVESSSFDAEEGTYLVDVRAEGGTTYSMYEHRFVKAEETEPEAGTTGFSDPEPVPEQGGGTDEITRLRESLAKAEAALEEVKAAHQSDIDTIGDRLTKEAQTREWCDEYDAIVRSLNTDLTVPIRKRFNDFEIALTAVVPMTWRGNATSEEDARERALRWVNRYTIDQNSRNFRDVEVSGVINHDAPVSEDDDDDDDAEDPFSPF